MYSLHHLSCPSLQLTSETMSQFRRLVDLSGRGDKPIQGFLITQHRRMNTTVCASSGVRTHKWSRTVCALDLGVVVVDKYKKVNKLITCLQTYQHYDRSCPFLKELPINLSEHYRSRYRFQIYRGLFSLLCLMPESKGVKLHIELLFGNETSLQIRNSWHSTEINSVTG